MSESSTRLSQSPLLSLTYHPIRYHVINEKGNWVGEIRDDLRMESFRGYLSELEKIVNTFKRRKLANQSFEDCIKPVKRDTLRFDPSMFSVKKDGNVILYVYWNSNTFDWDHDFAMDREVWYGITTSHIVKELKRRIENELGTEVGFADRFGVQTCEIF